MTKKYYAYDHSNENILIFNDFGVFMYWIDNEYDKERFSVYEIRGSLVTGCKEYDNPIDKEKNNESRR